MTSNKIQSELIFRPELCSESPQKLLAENINITKRTHFDRHPERSRRVRSILSEKSPKKKMLNITKRTQAYSQVRGPLPQASMDYSPFTHSREFAVMWCAMTTYGRKMDSSLHRGSLNCAMDFVRSGLKRWSDMSDGNDPVYGSHPERTRSRSLVEGVEG